MVKQATLADRWKDPPEIVTGEEEIQEVHETLEVLTGKREMITEEEAKERGIDVD